MSFQNHLNDETSILILHICPDVSVETTNMSMQTHTARIIHPALSKHAEVYADRELSADVLGKLKVVQDVESSATKDTQGFSRLSFKADALPTPKKFYTQGDSSFRHMGSPITRLPESFGKKATGRRGLEAKKPLKQGAYRTKMTSNGRNTRSSGCSSRSYNAASFTSCTMDSSEDSKVSEALDTSDIDEELAEDYVLNLAGEISLDLLETEMSARDIALSQTPIDSIMMNSQSLHISGDSTFSCESSDEEDEDSDLNTVCFTRKASDKRVCLSQSDLRKLMKKDEDLKSGLLTGRILFEEDSGYSSEEEGSLEGDCLLKEEYHLRFLALDDAIDHDSAKEDKLDRIIQESEGPFMLESRAFSKRSRKHRKPAHLEQGTLILKKSANKGLPGQKKRQRKETIAAKRRERALSRGVNFEAINLTLQRLVKDHGDIFAFEPMTNQDRSLVYKLASVYHLKSASQGSGKKRFVVVTRSQHTCLPSGDDEHRLLKLLGRDGAETDPFQGFEIVGSGEKYRLAKKYRRAARQAWHSLKQSKSQGALSKYSGFKKSESTPKKNFHSKKSTVRNGILSSSPLCFVSSGTIEPDYSSDLRALPKIGKDEACFDIEDHLPGDSSCTEQNQSVTKVCSIEFGQFEAHTKGFGSRMMAKMGFVEGHGLGRDGQGIIQPVTAIQRPRTLGLGACT
ncbi:hypothetical protein O6H91_13G040400 [Diphasiastrum complanatum]|uniref:Uncharacterized protein n=1 Tax=Diphasiastrum complanatum TaxID=34168 RepID=A0ACC2BU50_DIPCM|nr:hypothetical protein O6H91_13G040400 [Diphasiastrum complanatum]